MKCPFCSFLDTKVIDSRPTEDNMAIRRRRVCLKCHKRFTTYERFEDQAIVVVKKDKTRESFSRAKVLRGMIKSCEKRPIAVDRLEKAADEIETALNHLNQKEVSSTYIGDLVMSQLKKIDKVAYVRFASVYREFEDVEKFYDELELLKDEDKED
ncbi:transcriptional regulator NrdR [Kallipyga massiliensis]|uniref:transcriptional regulator NrdR n=1 Tax=Kallipyga massiliensis TaxID=1472764 RepID=UPI000557DB10|nr:transcriptional regulator NrdR [Kallipyga massiliensis]